MSALQDILSRYRAASQTEREKGTYFRHEASYSDLYSDGWLHADWAAEVGSPQFGFSSKDTGIVNDANLWATETMGNARYPLELLLRVITVSIETMKIVHSLPPLGELEG